MAAELPVLPDKELSVEIVESEFIVTTELTVDKEVSEMVEDELSVVELAEDEEGAIELEAVNELFVAVLVDKEVSDVASRFLLLQENVWVPVESGKVRSVGHELGSEESETPLYTSLSTQCQPTLLLDFLKIIYLI